MWNLSKEVAVLYAGHLQKGVHLTTRLSLMQKKRGPPSRQSQLPAFNGVDNQFVLDKVQPCLPLKVHSQRDRGAPFDLDIAVVESSYGTGNWYVEQVSKEMVKSSCNKNNAIDVHQTTNTIKYSTMYKLYLQSILYSVLHSTGLALAWVSCVPDTYNFLKFLYYWHPKKPLPRNSCH